MPLGAFRLNTLGKNAAGTQSYWYNILSGDAVGDRSLKSVVDSTGNVYVVGNYSSDETGLIFKFNSSGVIQWQKAMTNGYVLRNIAIDSTDGVYVCGGDESGSPAKPWLAKINTTDGSLTWQKTHTSDLGFSNEFWGMTIDTSNNIDLCGRNNLSTGYYAGTYARYSTSGTKVYSYSNTPTNSYPEHLAICQSGSTTTSSRMVGIYTAAGLQYGLVCNRAVDRTTTYYYSRMSTGLTSYGGNVFNDCVYEPTGLGYYAVGGTYEGGAGKAVIVKIASGTSIVVTWARYLGVSTDITSCCLDSSGNLYATYNDASIGYIVKFNSSGTIQWTKSIAGTSGIVSLYGIKWVNNSLYITGQTTINTTADPMVWKVPDDGTKTGTYGSFTYATPANPTVTNYTPTFTSITNTNATRTNTVSSTTVTPTATTMTSTTTSL